MSLITVSLALVAIFQATDAQAIGACIGGACPTGYECLNNVCYTSIGPCIGGSCPVGTCVGAVNGQGGTCVNTAATTAAPAVATTTVACVDLAAAGRASDCPQNAYLCNDAIYKALMTQQCPKTCGICTSSGGSTTTCVDKVGPTGVSDCPKSAYLCNNAIYKSLMADQCPKTCGLC